MKKTIIIVAAIVLVLGVAIFIFIWQKGSMGTPTNPGSTGSLPIATTTAPAQHPTGTTFQIGTPQGTVAVNNFYNNPAQTSQDGTSIVIAESSTYNITYYVPDSSFNIGIVKGPVLATRATAETAFLAALGISKADACKLNVIIGVPYDVDPSYADQNLGLSFCANGAFQSQ